MVEQRREIRFLPLEVRTEISPVSDFRGVIRLLRVIKREGPFDVIHGHSSKGGGLARIAGRLAAVPTVYTPNSLIMAYPDISRQKAALYTLIEYIFGRCATSRIIAVSEEERELILSLSLVPSNRIMVIQNGIEDRDFEVSPRESVHKDISQEPLTFGSVMRFSAQKAPGDLVEAFIWLNEALPQLPTRLVIAGDGELFAKTRRQVEECGLDEHISLPGWTDAREVLRELDVFVIPSLYEGLSYAVLEAMAAKLPVVSTSVFGMRETLCRVPGNIIVPAGNPTALAGGMRRMATLSDTGSLRQVLRRIGQANHDYVRAHFKQSDVVRRTLEVYWALCRQHLS